jgi:acyl-CoA thioester hydrolase
MHRTQLRPLFADVDAMDVVYYGNYLKYFEKGRAELMRAAGSPYSALHAMGIHMPVTEASLHYLQPAHYDELLIVETRVAWVKKASMQFTYRILKPGENGEEKELVTGHTSHACVSNQGRIVRLPPENVAALKSHLDQPA